MDSVGLPLNISRGSLRQDKVLHVINQNLVMKCLDILRKSPREVMAARSTTNSFAGARRFGFIVDLTNHTENAKVLMFNASECGLGMKAGPNDIYYFNGERIVVLSFSPFEENVRKNILEVLSMVDPWMNMPCNRSKNDEVLAQQVASIGKSVHELEKEKPVVLGWPSVNLNAHARASPVPLAQRSLPMPSVSKLSRARGSR